MKTYTSVTYNLHEDLHDSNVNLHEDLHDSDVQITWRPTRPWHTIYMKIYTAVT